MPTTKPRYAITETEEVAEALRFAALKWPDDRERPSRLILRLVAEGGKAISPEIEARRARRLAAIEDFVGAYNYPDNYLEDLRSEWPE